MRARTDNASAGAAASVLEDVRAYTGECPQCGKRKLYVLPPRVGRWGIGCYVCCPPGADWRDARDYLREVAEAVGCRPYQLLDDALTYLGFLLYGARSNDAEPGALPTIAQRQRWASALLDSREPLARLGAERGLTVETVRTYGIGWDDVRNGYTLPIWNQQAEVVNVSWRAPKGEILCLPSGARTSKYRIAGRRADNGCLPLYPMPRPVGTWWLLVEGEWDALVARQHGLPAFTGLLGKQWNAVWDGDVAERSIAVAYDVGAGREADATVQRLRAAGAEAWRVDLRLPNEGDDVCDWFVKYGKLAAALHGLAAKARRRARRGV